MGPTQYIVGAFVRLGALEPLHPNADEWLLQALHKHGGEDGTRSCGTRPSMHKTGPQRPDVESGARAAGGRGPRRGEAPNSSGAGAGASGESGRVGAVLAVREVALAPQGRRRFITTGRLDLRRLECLVYEAACSLRRARPAPAIQVQRILVWYW